MNMFEKGLMAKSLAGHDAGKIYVILDSKDEYVYLVDGDVRKVDNPKKKNKKHLQIIKISAIKELPIINEDVKRSIKLYNSGINN